MEILLIVLVAALAISLALALVALFKSRERTAQSETRNALLRQAQEQAEQAHGLALQQAEQHTLSQLQALRLQWEEKTQALNRQAEERLQMQTQQYEERLRVQTQQAEERLQTQSLQYKERLQMQDQQAQERLKALAQQHEAQMQTQHQQHETLMQTLRRELDKLTQQHLDTQREQLKAENAQRITELLTPLKLKVDEFQKDFQNRMGEHSRTNAVMEDTLKKLAEQTQQLGKNADDLTHALKADPKKQGNWGEAVLRNILEASGLTEGVDFTCQQGVRGEDGREYIPDVKVALPDGHCIIVDSKTSIADYLDYVSAETEPAREQALKQHLRSVRNHVKELADIHYQEKVSGAQEYVLMFIPNEGSYLLAMENDPKLATEAYMRHVIIVNPTNLMLALSIVYLFRQNERQTKSVREIIEAAKKLYDKFATFSQSFVKLGEAVRKTAEVYTQAEGQLLTGSGNFSRQLENFKKKGVVTDKQINPKLLPEE